jgi:hypothetical protein
MIVAYIAHALTVDTREGIEQNRIKAAKWAAWALVARNVGKRLPGRVP